MKKVMVSSLVLALVLGIVAVADAAGRGAGQKRSEMAAAGGDNLVRNGGVKRLPAPRFVGGTRVVGSIQYDDGVIAASLGVNSVCVGNQFDTTGGANPLTASGTITAASIYMVSVGGGAAFFSVFDQLAGATANPVTSASLPMTTGLNALTFAPINYVGSTFLAGAWQFNTDVVGISTGTTGGQGFHGMSINDIVATGFNRPGTFNGVTRATGNILSIPVELTGFEIVGE